MPQMLFKTKAVKITTLGEYLQQARQKLNLDIKTVSVLGQIKPVYLQNLEAGHWESLPAEVYLRGFLKSLAQVYQLSEQVLIDQFEKEYGFEFKNQPKDNQLSRKVRVTPKTVLVTLTLVLVLAAATYIAFQIHSVLAAPYLEVLEPVADGAIAGTTLIVSGRAEIGSDITINKQLVLADRNGRFSESLFLSSGVNVIEVEAVNKFGKTNKVIRKINATITSVKVPASSSVAVTIQVGPESAWIYLEADGLVVQRGTMLPGSVSTIAAKQDVILTSSNAGSTKVIYNGQDLGVLGRSGEVVRNVEFTSQTLH